jgi:hypothetical protein
MNRTRIKICGLTREQDIDTAVAAGVDAIGFVMYAPSPRAVAVERAAELARAHSMQTLKLYLMVGLPTETDEDIDELIRFSLELSRILPTSLGVAPFAAKRNTPLDGAPFAGIDVVEKRLERLRKGLRGRAELRPTSARWAWVEYMLAQCGPEGGLAAMDAWKAGAHFSAWKKAFLARECQPYQARRTVDGRRNAVETSCPTAS